MSSFREYGAHPIGSTNTSYLIIANSHNLVQRIVCRQPHNERTDVNVPLDIEPAGIYLFSGEVPGMAMQNSSLYAQGDKVSLVQTSHNSLDLTVPLEFVIFSAMEEIREDMVDMGEDSRIQ